tara:strand:- start:10098 stop:10307 length:210 start_codon:yes stop_codon:yes gene_type:complete
MKVKATKKGFDGETLREEGDVFYFEAFAVKEDGTNNLGSWMESMEDLPKPKKKPVKKKPVIDEPEITSE